MKIARITSAVCLLALLVPLSNAWGQAATEASAVQSDLPSADDVLEKYFEAIGSKMKYSNIKSMVVKGSMSIPEQGIGGEFTIHQKAPNKMVMVMSFEGIGEQSFGHDGETSWQISAMTGAEILEGEQAEQFAMQAEVAPFLKLEEKYDSVTCTGKKEFNGEDCYVIVAEKKERDPITHYFSVKSGLHTGTEMTQVSQMGKMEVVNKIEDYKEVDGIKISYKSIAELPIGMSVVTEIKSVEIDGKIEDSKFDLPDEIKELKK